jgi:hypothetical protein
VYQKNIHYLSFCIPNYVVLVTLLGVVAYTIILLRFYTYGSNFHTINVDVTYNLPVGEFSTLQLLGHLSSAIAVMFASKSEGIVTSRFYSSLLLLPGAEPDVFKPRYGTLVHRSWDIDSFIFDSPSRTRSLRLAFVFASAAVVALWAITDFALKKTSSFTP